MSTLKYQSVAINSYENTGVLMNANADGLGANVLWYGAVALPDSSSTPTNEWGDTPTWDGSFGDTSSQYPFGFPLIGTYPFTDEGGDPYVTFYFGGAPPNVRVMVHMWGLVS